MDYKSTLMYAFALAMISLALYVLFKWVFSESMDLPYIEQQDKLNPQEKIDIIKQSLTQQKDSKDTVLAKIPGPLVQAESSYPEIFETGYIEPQDFNANGEFPVAEMSQLKGLNDFE